jgi:hypothetical protein
MRMVWADWLEDHGATEHAEFIRLQCQKPYITLSYLDPHQPTMGIYHDFPRDETTAQARLDRLTALLPPIYHSDRYERQRSIYFPEEHVRGLPLNQVTAYTIEFAHSLLTGMSHFARLDIFLETDRLTDWLAHPIMSRVDRLHIVPQIPSSADEDDHRGRSDAFWAEQIPILAASPLLDRLEELNPHECDSRCLSDRGIQNMARFKALIEPRVKVDYDY